MISKKEKECDVEGCNNLTNYRMRGSNIYLCKEHKEYCENNNVMFKLSESKTVAKDKEEFCCESCVYADEHEMFAKCKVFNKIVKKVCNCAEYKAKESEQAKRTQESKNNHLRRKRAEWKEKGLCIRCGKDKPIEGITFCRKCQEGRHDNFKKNQDNKREYVKKNRDKINKRSKKYYEQDKEKNRIRAKTREEYLKTWICNICGKEGYTEFHHPTYEKDNYVEVCTECHGKIHRA